MLQDADVYFSHTSNHRTVYIIYIYVVINKRGFDKNKTPH